MPIYIFSVEVDAELCGGSHVKGVLLADNRGLSVAVQVQ